MRSLLVGLLLALSWLGTGCSSSPGDVVVYAALDREFSEPILHDFAKETGLRPIAKYDVESTKTVGLTQAITSEANRPRCDVFWNNEILNSLRLQERGLLEVYHSPSAQAFPENFRDPAGTWCGFAGRARILLVNTKLVPEEERPSSIYDLAAPQWKGRIGIAKPLFGTTASHMACLFATLGEEKAKAFLTDLKANDVQILSGNKQVAQAVAAGQIAFGLTDTDDAIMEIENTQPVVIVYPDREADQLGTLFIPNTVCIIKGSPHPKAAKKLVDYLLTPAVEKKLALCPSAQIPLNPAVEVEPRVETPKTVKAMPVDFAAAAKAWDATAKYLKENFTRE